MSNNFKVFVNQKAYRRSAPGTPNDIKKPITLFQRLLLNIKIIIRIYSDISY